jgi:hypothetical protein
MFDHIRKILWGVVLTTGLALVLPAVARADDPPNMQDYNTYWQVAQSPTPPSPTLDYNTYWAEVQAQQQSGPDR